MRSRRGLVCLSAMLALGAVSGAPVVHPAAVLAASGTVSLETALYDSPDPAASVITLLPAGTSVSLEGPPVDGFYPVTAGDLSGWMRGETVQVEKDLAEPDAAEDTAVDAPLDQTDEVVPADASTELDPALSTTVEPASEPAVDTSAETEASAPAAAPVLGDQTMPPTEPVPADGMTLANEPVAVDAVDVAVPLPDPAPPAVEGAAEPSIDSNVVPIPVAEISAVGPASVMVEAPILAGPGPEYGFIATAPVGSTVEQTGHVINGYATVQYAEVTGWLALEHLGAPGTVLGASPLGETAPPVEKLPANAPLAEPSPPEFTPTETPPTETPPETPTAETPPAETVPVVAPIDGP